MRARVGSERFPGARQDYGGTRLLAAIFRRCSSRGRQDARGTSKPGETTRSLLRPHALPGRAIQVRSALRFSPATQSWTLRAVAGRSCSREGPARRNADGARQQARILHERSATGADPCAVTGRTPSIRFGRSVGYAFSVFRSVRPATAPSRRPRDESSCNIRARSVRRRIFGGGQTGFCRRGVGRLTERGDSVFPCSGAEDLRRERLEGA